MNVVQFPKTLLMTGRKHSQVPHFKGSEAYSVSVLGVAAMEDIINPVETSERTRLQMKGQKTVYDGKYRNAAEL